MTHKSPVGKGFSYSVAKLEFFFSAWPATAQEPCVPAQTQFNEQELQLTPSDRQPVRAHLQASSFGTERREREGRALRSSLKKS